MEKVNRSEEILREVEDRKNKIAAIQASSKEAAMSRFEENGGCQTCRGRGWVVTWDTLDCVHGSYAEYGACPEENCTKESRSKSGLLPENNKYDRMRGTTWRYSHTIDDAQEISNIECEIRSLNRDLSIENNRWSPSAGKLVKTVRQGKGPISTRTPVGTVGLVKKVFSNNWGTRKLIVIDESGNKWWPNANHVEVIDPEPDTLVWDEMAKKERETNGYPVVVTVKKKTAKACLLRTTTAVEFWVPFSQAAELKDSKRFQTLSVMLPMWLAEKKGLVKKGKK